MLAGYLSLSRSFAYLGLPTLLVPLGLPAIPLYLGELSLAAFVLAKPSLSVGRWFKAMLAPSPLSGVSWSFYALFFYGIFEVLRGISLGYPPITALQSFAFNFYPLYFFLGLWIGGRRPNFLPKFVRAFAWWNGIYGVAYMLFLHQLPFFLPGTEVPLFSQPTGSAIALVGLLCYERRLMNAWLPILLNCFVLLGIQVRAEWAGFVAALLLWGWLAKRLSRVLAGVAAVGLLLLLGALLDINLPSPRGEIATRELIGRGIAPVNPELAAQYTEEAEVYAGTVSWRTAWWSAIWNAVHDEPETALIGLGYGYPLATLALEVPPIIRTPHNVFFYALGYSGWLGVVFFACFQIALGRLLWRARGASQLFGLAVFVMGLTISLFSNFFETPFNAISFYLLVGIAAAPALSVTAPPRAQLPSELRLRESSASAVDAPKVSTT
ncbi:MAG: O-antigen ligase family protein, partial [Actinomycetota bacterium]|nr:O-antigen ligase family protein [Actinomycetota bacterium]